MVGGGECNTRCPSRDDMGSAGTSAAAKEATSHVGVAGSTEKAVEPLPPECRVPRVQGGGGRDPAISVEVQWRKDGARCKALTVSLADAHFQAMGREVKGRNHVGTKSVSHHQAFHGATRS